MTREKQIRQASIEYTIKDRPMCIGGGAFSEVVYEMNRNYAFEAGVKWADNNPDVSTLWHDASEIPTAKETVLLVQEDGRIFVIEYGCQAIYKRNASWEKVFQMYQPTKWAYISDLLPKGGEK